jgi:hypothetical protein
LPWYSNIKEDYANTSQVYSDLVDALIEHTSTDKTFFLRELYIHSEIMKYDFTKRQRAILTFIIGLSYNFGKNTCVIPLLRDFETCGVQAHKASNELQNLVEIDIISWEKETNEFGIKDPRFWKAKKNYGYKRERARELFLLNLKHAGIDANSIIKKSLEKGGKF